MTNSDRLPRVVAVGEQLFHLFAKLRRVGFEHFFHRRRRRDDEHPSLLVRRQIIRGGRRLVVDNALVLDRRRTAPRAVQRLERYPFLQVHHQRRLRCAPRFQRIEADQQPLDLLRLDARPDFDLLERRGPGRPQPAIIRAPSALARMSAGRRYKNCRPPAGK